MKNMKKILIVLVVLAFIVAGCGNTKVIDGVEYDTYGLFNEGKMKNENVEYRLIVGNVVWSIILVETIVFPIYFVGFSIYEPVGKKGEVIKGKI
jgi:hypothetical protein